jgi:iron complex transport system substrate-binding protein
LGRHYPHAEGAGKFILTRRREEGGETSILSDDKTLWLAPGLHRKAISRGDAEDAEKTNPHFFRETLRSGKLMQQIDDITGQIVDAAFKVHSGLGPGLLESVYETVLARELARRGLNVERNGSVAFVFDGLSFDQGLCVDLLVEGQVVVELKSVEKLAAVHHKQVLTYLRLLHLPVGLLINFGGVTLKEGLHRIVNHYEPPSDSPLAVNQGKVLGR